MSTTELTGKPDSGLVIEDGILKSCNTREANVTVPSGVHTIGEGAFKGCTSLERVNLPDTISVVAANAFKGCRRLVDIRLPEGVREIGEYAFHRCHSLKEISLPASVTALGNCVFLYCDSLETVRMPGVKTLGLQVFLNDIRLKSILISDQLDIEHICDCFTGCSGLKEIATSNGSVYHMENAVAVMASETEAPAVVKAIAADICRMMELKEGVITRFLTNLKRVELAEGITGVGKSCFFDKKGIISVRFPSTLREIESRAFRNCINLERVEFLNSQVEIHKDAFKNCTTLHTVCLPDGTEYELAGLCKPEDAALPAVVKEIQSQVLGNFSISGTVLLRYRGSEERVVVPYGITEIAERAFAGNEAVDRVILPDTVEVIGEEAFADCLVMQTINFPKGLHVIGRSAFENCVKLIRAILPESLTRLSPSAFNRCRTLHEVCLGSRTTEIGDLAFYGCTSLKAIVLPETLKRLGDMAFYRCVSLKEVVLPASLDRIGSNVFTHSGVKRAVVRCSPSSCGTDVFSQCGRLQRLIFEEGVRCVGDKFAFCCGKLETVSLPPSIETIGKHAFAESPYLEHLPADKTVHSILLDGSGYTGAVVLDGEIRAIAGGAFYGNTAITSISLPERLEWIGPWAFCGCTGLTEAVLPKRVTCIEEGTFARCTALKSALAAGGAGQITEVKARAFLNCSELYAVPAMNGCLSIGKEAFAGCKKLAGIDGLTLGRSGSPEASTSFVPASSVSSSNISGPVPSIGDSAFAGTPFLESGRLGEETGLSGAVIVSGIVVEGSALKGKAVVPEGVVGIADYAFCGNDAIRSLLLPKSLRAVGTAAFAGCRNLEEVSFSGPLETLGPSAFAKCISLAEMSCDVPEIGAGAFAWCTSLRSVSFDETVSVGDGAFCGCAALNSCHMAALRLIGREAFSGCRELAGFSFGIVHRIGERAFERCDALRSVTLPSLAVVSAHTFEDCGRLEEVRVEGLQTEEGGEEDRLEVCLKEASYAFSGCTALCRVILAGRLYELHRYEALFDGTLPEGVRRVYGSAMSCYSIDEDLSLNEYRNNGRFLVIPEGIRRIGEEVFRDRSRLEEIVIPDTVEYIGPRAFDKTTWLERLRAENHGMPAVVNSILTDGSDSAGEVVIGPEISRVSGWAFANCTELTKIAFTSSRTAAEPHAFRNCIRLQRITLADGTEYNVDGLDFLKMDLPPMVRQIAADCYNCFKMEENGVLAECTGNISRLALPSGIRVIGRGALKESNLLTELHLPKGVTAIEEGAFEQCKWLESVEGTSELVRIGRRAFSGCLRLKRLEDLLRLSFLGEGAFENCTSLDEIVIGEGVTEIPYRAFFRCCKLRRVVLPGTIKAIGREAFAFCSSLSDIVLPAGIERVEERAFAWCKESEESL